MGLFVTTDAKEIKDHLIDIAQKGCSTTLYQGDERRIFGESMVAWTVIVFNTFFYDIIN